MKQRWEKENKEQKFSEVASVLCEFIYIACENIQMIYLTIKNRYAETHCMITNKQQCAS